jgi:hypothetical protein
MKRLFFILLTFISFGAFSQTDSVPFAPYYINWLYESSGTIDTNSDIIITPEQGFSSHFSGPDYDGLTGTSIVNFTAVQSLTLLPGFQAGGYSTTGHFLGSIGTGPITDAQIMGTDTIAYQFQKFEIGMNLENDLTYPYINMIDNFIFAPQNPPYNIYPVGNLLDPYDPTQVMVKAVFTALGSGNQYIRYGFYQQPVTVTNSGTQYQFGIDQHFPFRIRIAPPEAGEYSVAIYLYINGSLAPGNQPFVANFNVQPTNNPGDIIVNQNCAWRLGYSNSSYDELFIPIGQDIPLADPNDPNTGGKGADANGNPTDTAYIWQRNYMRNLALHGGNYLRVFMTPGCGGIECFAQGTPSNTSVQPVICDYNQDACYEMDSTLTVCEKNGLYLQLSGMDETNLQTNSNWAPYQWNTSFHTLNNNPYYYLLLGNSSATVEDFFTSTLAQEYYKKRLFYTEARWGYSPNVAVWELANEIDHIGDCQDTDDYKKNKDNLATDVGNWTDTMVNYLHSFYPSHLVTMSYAGDPDSVYDNSPPNFDILTIHDYNDGEPNYRGDENYNRVKWRQKNGYYHSQYDNFNLLYSKPLIYGEVGNSCSMWVSCDQLQDYSFHNAVWASLFTSAGTALNWNDWEQNVCTKSLCNSFPAQIHRNNFDAVKNFVNATITSFNVLNNQVPYWDTVHDVEYYYMAGTDAELGWLKNATYSWENISYGACIHNLCSDADSIGKPDTTITTSLTFTGLTWDTWFIVHLFNPYTKTFIPEGNQYSGMGSLSHPIPITLAGAPTWTTDNTIAQPDYGYVVSEYALHAPVHPNDSDVIVLPNDTVYLPMDSVHYIGSMDNQHKNYKFSWNFGNGLTSNAQPFPKFIYHSIGNYLTSVGFTDSAGGDKTIMYQTYVVLDSASRPKYGTYAQSRKLNSHSNSINTSDSVNAILKDFTLVPNPTNGTFTLYSEYGQSISTIEIYDVLGRKCFSSYAPKSTVFSISTFSAGMYFVKIYSGSKIYNKKLIKE